MFLELYNGPEKVRSISMYNVLVRVCSDDQYLVAYTDNNNFISEGSVSHINGKWPVFLLKYSYLTLIGQ